MKRFDKDKDKNLTVLGKETVFDGVMKFSENLHINGEFSGTIDAQGFLLISKTAVCKADYIKAASVVVEGSVTGSISAQDKIELKTGCSVNGNLTASRLKIADEASFEGQIKMIHDDKHLEGDIFSADIGELKEQLRRKND